MALLVVLSSVLALLCHLNTNSEAVLPLYILTVLFDVHMLPPNTRFCQDNFNIPHYLMVTLLLA